MHPHLKRTLVIIAGILFIVVGVFGLVLPGIQGILFIVIGLLILSAYSPSIRRWLDKHTERFPMLNSFVEKAEAWIVKVIGKP